MAFAANTAVSTLYRVYQAEFRFSATTLTALLAAYILVLCAISHRHEPSGRGIWEATAQGHVGGLLTRATRHLD